MQQIKRYYSFHFFNSSHLSGRCYVKFFGYSAKNLNQTIIGKKCFLKLQLGNSIRIESLEDQLDMMYSQLYIYTWYIWIFRTVIKNDKSLKIYFVK